ncbi:hypothetical protein [Listeria rocourtiae]|uniref:hypothetical protein n=1 Tax=Listeria rocourtiae TaxID=647910 RepID=UPI003D2F7252
MYSSASPVLGRIEKKPDFFSVFGADGVSAFATFFFSVLGFGVLVSFAGVCGVAGVIGSVGFSGVSGFTFSGSSTGVGGVTVGISDCRKSPSLPNASSAWFGMPQVARLLRLL